MKRWCYQCGESNEVDARKCSDCGAAFPGRGSPTRGRSALVPPPPPDEDLGSSDTRLIGAASAMTTIGVAVMVVAGLFFAAVVAVAFFR